MRAEQRAGEPALPGCLIPPLSATSCVSLGQRVRVGYAVRCARGRAELGDGMLPVRGSAGCGLTCPDSTHSRSGHGVKGLHVGGGDESGRRCPQPRQHGRERWFLPAPPRGSSASQHLSPAPMRRPQGPLLKSQPSFLFADLQKSCRNSKGTSTYLSGPAGDWRLLYHPLSL